MVELKNNTAYTAGLGISGWRIITAKLEVKNSSIRIQISEKEDFKESFAHINPKNLLLP